MARLQEEYIKNIKPNLMKELGLKNIFSVPELKKVVINMGLGIDGNDTKILSSCQEDLASITGQKPIITKFRKSIANFKLREGNPIGLFVTLRGDRMYHFMDRLINVALPRIRDFRGISGSRFRVLCTLLS